MKMREKLIEEGIDKDYIALSFFGDGEYLESVPAVYMKK